MVVPEIDALWKDAEGVYCIAQLYKNANNGELVIGYHDLVSGEKWALDIHSWNEQNYIPIEVNMEFVDERGTSCKIAYVNSHPLQGSVGLVVIKNEKRVKILYSDFMYYNRKEDD